MSVRNLNNENMGMNSPLYSFRVDYKTKDIFDEITKIGMNVSQFIRMSVLYYWENEILGNKEELIKEYEKMREKKRLRKRRKSGI